MGFEAKKNMDRNPSEQILVTIPGWLSKHIKDQEGHLGNSKSEVLRNIAISYLAEHGITKPNGINGEHNGKP